MHKYDYAEIGMTKMEIFRLSKIKKYEVVGIEKFKEDLTIKTKKKDCDDWFHVTIREINPNIKDIKFSHKGCLLSRSAMNAIIESIEEKTTSEAIDILINFKKMIAGDKFEFDIPERLLIFKRFIKFPSRRHCICIGCDTILKVIKKKIQLCY